ncbi:RagB/SusD family nutrient uptake outer membrane protein [Parabacteroides sp.]|nr:RagB/SusD family nutrient uptake outer membrane protein [Parabacteroides sp.]
MLFFVWDSPSGGMFQFWAYDRVRKINYLIENLPQYAPNFPESLVNTWLGEAYFCRAYYYFAMVNRYGAVPLVKEVKNYPETSIEELQIPRNTQQEGWEFVAEDLDKAIELLPETSLERGRINKYVAYGLKSRAMLYAASLCQFDTPASGYEELLGMPASKAQSYYQAAYDAASKLEGKYSLYNKYTDKFENYWNLFLDEDNPEVVFAEYYQYPEKTHSWDVHQIPFQIRGPEGYSGILNPTLEIVELFDDVEGNPFILKTVDEKGEPIRYDDPFDIFKGVEPRLRASVILPNDEYKGETIEIRKGIWTSYPDGELKTTSDFSVMYKDMPVMGKSGMGHNETTTTGFLVRKYQNPNMPNSQVIHGRSTTQFIEMRYAEILLNRAEAAFYLGKKQEALDLINQVRERAGAKLYTLNQLTEDNLRKERRMELVFENHSFWDLRRWRIADKLMNNKKYTALYPYYVYDEGKYIFTKEEVGTTYTYDVKVNYAKVPAGEISKNPNLLPDNPGY